MPEESVNAESASEFTVSTPLELLSSRSRELAGGAATEQLICQILVTKENCGTYLGSRSVEKD